MKKRYFTMLEMLCAMALMAVLIVVFSSIQTRMTKARDTFARETQGILVMQNTIQRLKLETEPTRDSAKRIFLEEAGFAGKLEPQITETADGMKLALLNHRKNATVEVTLKCAK